MSHNLLGKYLLTLLYGISMIQQRRSQYDLKVLNKDTPITTNNCYLLRKYNLYLDKMQTK